MVLLYVALKLFQIFGFKFARNYDDIYGTSAIALRSRIPTLLETKMFIAWQHNEHHESLSRFFRPGYVFFQLHPCFHAHRDMESAILVLKSSSTFCDFGLPMIDILKDDCRKLLLLLLSWK